MLKYIFKIFKKIKEKIMAIGLGLGIHHQHEMHLHIGMDHQGGMIFYLDGNGGGLITSMDNLTNAIWGCRGTDLSGADGTAIGTGEQNTLDIQSGCPLAGSANTQCYDLSLNGYNDWFLPSKDELIQMHAAVGQGANNEAGFGDVTYWSSSESGKNTAWTTLFTTGVSTSLTDKNATYRVRAIRSF